MGLSIAFAFARSRWDGLVRAAKVATWTTAGADNDIDLCTGATRVHSLPMMLLEITTAGTSRVTRPDPRNRGVQHQNPETPTVYRLEVPSPISTHPCPTQPPLHPPTKPRIHIIISHVPAPSPPPSHPSVYRRSTSIPNVYALPPPPHRRPVPRRVTIRPQVSVHRGCGCGCRWRMWLVVNGHMVC